jgi:hypothetical protein
VALARKDDAMGFAGLALVSVIVMAICVLAMAVGVLIRNKGFKSCGCASITFRGEKIRCPGCSESEGEACVEEGGTSRTES